MDCPLSPPTQALRDPIIELRAKRVELLEIEGQGVVTLAEAAVKFEQITSRMNEAGDFSAEGRRRARVESGLVDAEESLAAIRAAIRSLPEWERAAIAKFVASQARERTVAYDRLAGEFRRVVKSHVLPHLREINKLAVPEVAKILAEVERWSEEGDDRRTYGGHSWPLFRTGFRGLLLWTLFMHASEIEDTKR